MALKLLDLKFHDIPNTVSRAIKASCNLGIWMVNLHASGGKQMMLAAREAVESSSHKPLLIAVTILTSLIILLTKSWVLKMNYRNKLLI